MQSNREGERERENSRMQSGNERRKRVAVIGILLLLLPLDPGWSRSRIGPAELCRCAIQSGRRRCRRLTTANSRRQSTEAAANLRQLPVQSEVKKWRAPRRVARIWCSISRVCHCNYYCYTRAAAEAALHSIERKKKKKKAHQLMSMKKVFQE